MSRIGKKPIAIPRGVTVNLRPGLAEVKGPRGTVKQNIHPDIKVAVDDKEQQVQVTRSNDEAQSKALHGLMRSLIANAVQGVLSGFEKRLEIVGTGYNAKIKGKTIEITVGFTMPRVVQIPEGVEVETPIPTKVVIKGCNKELVGQVAASIRATRPPEPYKGKGVRYENEVIKFKSGKSFGGAGAG